MDLNTFFKKPKSPIGTNHTYGLTPLGKTKTEDLAIAGVKADVASYLNENGASSINEISEETKISNEKIKKIMRVLIANGYVRRVNSES